MYLKKKTNFINQKEQHLRQLKHYSIKAPTLLNLNQATLQFFPTKLQVQDFPLQQMEILLCNMHEAPENIWKKD